MSQRHADIWSHPGHDLVDILKPDLGHQMVMVINNLLQPPLFNENQPSHSEIQLSMVKAMCVVKGQGNIWPWKFKGQRCHGQTHWSHLRPRVPSICLLFVSWQSDNLWLRYSKFHIGPWKFKVNVMAKVKPDGHIWGLNFNWHICFSFRENRTTFGWDIANSIYDLENSRSRSWQRSNPMVTFEAQSCQSQSMCLLSVSWQSDHFWLRYSKFHIWPWKFKVKVTTKIDQNLVR